VHRTLSGAQAGASMNSLLSGIAKDAVAKIHRTVWCAPDCSVSQQSPRHGRQRYQSAINGRRVARANSHHAAPDTVRCAKGTAAATVAFAKQGKKLCTVHVRWCTGLSGAPTTEGKNCLPNGAPTTPCFLGAIKETPRRMEQYTKPPLNILRSLDSTSTHLIQCV
jgi:hypothetical protein